MKIKRLSGQEMAAIVQPAPAAPSAPASRERSRDAELVQINFRCSQQMARLLGQMAEREGKPIRAVVARLLIQDGRKVPEADCVAVTNRRWR